MKKRQYINSRVSKVVTLLATSTLLVVSFQNCSKGFTSTGASQLASIANPPAAQSTSSSGSSSTGSGSSQSGSGSSQSGSGSQASAPFQKVLIVVFENSSYSVALSQPFFAQFAKEGALLTNFSAESHPSQGNYIALVAGDEYNAQYDVSVVVQAPNVGDLLSASGLLWKNYAEGFPGNCYLGWTDGLYARRHVPFISFADVENNPKNCANVVNAQQWATDLQTNSLPAYSLYSPNVDDDGHNTSAAFASQWFSQFMSNLSKYPNATSGLLIIATFDEADNTSTTNHVYTALYGAGIVPGSSSNLAYNHYSILRTIEDDLKLGTLNKQDSVATPIQGIWK